MAAKDAIDGVKSLNTAQKAAIKSSKAGEVNMGDLESSYAFQRMTTNLVVTKKKKNADLDKQYTATPAASVTLEGREVQKGGRLKVLERKGTKVRVRDDRGNEGEVAADALEAR